MLRVRLDGLDDQIEFVGAVDLAGYAVVAVRRDLLGFGEVIQAVDPAGGVVLHEEHDTAAVFHTREQEQMIGAEVEHRKEDQRAGVMDSRSPPAAPLRGYPADSSARDIVTERRLIGASPA